MPYVKLFEAWVNEGLTADQIAANIETAVGGSGTEEDELVKAIKQIPDVQSLANVNRSMKTGAEQKGWTYRSVGDAINGELGYFDQTYKDQIDSHIKKIKGENYLSAYTAPPAGDPVITKIEPRVIKHEGYKPKVYIDSRGNPTVGVGFNLNRADSSDLLKKVGANPVKIKSGKAELTDAQIKALLRTDLKVAKQGAQTLVSADGKTNLSIVWPRLPLDVQGVLTEMIFNLGKKGLSEFNNFLAHLAKNQYSKAATEMLNSSWSKQVGNRANTLADVIKSAA